MKMMPETISRYDRDTFSVFRILPWSMNGDNRTITMHYALDDVHRFSEVVTLPESLPLAASTAVDFGDRAVTGVIDLLAVIAGVSYFKVAAPRRIDVAFPLTTEGRTIAVHAYDEGLREFAFRAGLEVPLITSWTVQSSGNTPPSPELLDRDRRPLMPMGGGRDSALLASILTPFDPILTVHGDNRFIDRLATVLERPIHRVARTLDPSLFTLNNGPALNGHVPVTAINSLIAVVTATLTGATDVVMANERSASAASLTTADGHSVNHQYSKSFEFEVLLGDAVASVGGPTYFSGLRPWSELAIARAFAGHAELHGAIMSCNRAFIRDRALRSDGWCGRCDKCRFVFLTLSPFMDRDDLLAMFGRDLFADASNDEGFAALVVDDQRPWDCVGEPAEARLAMELLTPRVYCSLAGVKAGDLRPTQSPEFYLAMAPSAEHRIPSPYREPIFEAMIRTTAQPMEATPNEATAIEATPIEATLNAGTTTTADE